MRVMQTVVSTEGYRFSRKNAARFALLDALLAKAGAEKCDLLVLPAGFLRARNPLVVYDLVAKIALSARQIAILGGIDVNCPAKSDLTLHIRRGGDLPYWGFAVVPGQTQRHWTQQSITRASATLHNAVNIQSRSLVINGMNVLPLTCGEIYNGYTRNSIPSGNFGLIAVSGHCDIRRQRAYTLGNLQAATGSAVLLSQHVKGSGGHFAFVDASGNDAAARLQSASKVFAPSGSPWARATVHTI